MPTLQIKTVTKDTSVSETMFTTNFGSSDSMEAGIYYGSQSEILIDFDRTALNTLIGKRIVSASLSLYCHGVNNEGGSILAVQPITSDWAETTVKYDNKPTSDPNYRGGNGELITTTGYFNFDAKKPLEYFVSGMPFYGLRLKFSIGYNDGGYYNFRTKEHANAATVGPVLNVTYEETDMPPTTPTNLTPSGSSINRAQINRFAWKHNDGNDPQSKFELKWRLSGGSWNVITQITTNDYYDVPANTFPAGSIEWYVVTYDQANNASPNSATSIVTSVTVSGPVITSPSNGATVSVSRPVVQWSHAEQTDYQLKVLNAAGTTTLWDSGQITSSVKSAPIGIDLSNSTSYQIHLAVRAQGVWTSFTVVNITTSFTQPKAPILTISTDDSKGFVTIAISNPTPSGSEPTVSYNEIYRRDFNDEWVRLASNIAPNGQFIDKLVRPYSAADYYVKAIGANGTTKQSVTSTEWVEVPYTQLMLVSDSSKMVTLQKGTQLSKRNSRESAKLQFEGRTYQVSAFGTQKEREFDYQFIVTSYSDVEMLEFLAECGQALLLRDNKGRKEYVAINEVSITEYATHWEVNVTPTRIDYTEGV